MGNFFSNNSVFHARKIPQETSMVGYSPRIPPKVSWNDSTISLSKDSGHFLYSWAVGPVCSILLMLQDSLPHKAELGTEIFFSRLWICLLSLIMYNWRNKKTNSSINENYSKLTLKYSEGLRKELTPKLISAVKKFLWSPL